MPGGPTRDRLFEKLLQPLLAHAAIADAELGTVPSAEVAYGTYGIVSGQLPDGRNARLTGYVVATHRAVAGYQGWTPEPCLVVTVATRPEALDGVAVAVPTGADLTVVTPPADAPAGTAAPWRQMPVVEQVSAALAEVGLRLHEDLDAQGRTRWTIPGVGREFREIESIATYLFGDDVWRGRVDPLLRQPLIDQAVIEDRWDGATTTGPTPLRSVRRGAYGMITGVVDGAEATVTGTYDRWWTPSHGMQRSDVAHVAVQVSDPDGQPNRYRVVTVGVPAAGAHFTVIDRPPLSEPAPATPAVAVPLAVSDDMLPLEILSRPSSAPTRLAPAAPGPVVAPAPVAAPVVNAGSEADADAGISETSTANGSVAAGAVLPPSGEAARVRANLDALRVLVHGIEAEQRPATSEEQATLARWSGWGATPGLFDERPREAARFAAERAELQQLLGDDAYRAARATTLNAHYTDPRLAAVVWAALGTLGFDGGSVLEPGCGSGNFLAGAPAGTRLLGVEVDPVTARIAQARFPHADIRSESFADTQLPDPGLDLVIGNVPFGSHKLHDPTHNPRRRHSIHNHFILKALAATRPGGLVALITSRYTMDGRDDAHQEARHRMAALADLVGAVRLPSGAHQAAAGTDVVTDLLVFRRREAGQPPSGPAWTAVRSVELPAAAEGVQAETFDINGYFLDRPELVLGRQLTGTGRARPTVVVEPGDTDVAAALARAFQQITAAEPAAPAVVLRGPTPDQEGLFIDAGDGRFWQVRDGRRARHEPPRTQVAELRALIGLRETILGLLDEEAAQRADTPQTQQLRADLNQQYDAYAAAFGAINRFQSSASTKVDKETGELVETERRTYPRMGGFRDDPFFPYVAALEKFDDDTGTAEKAEVFRQRVITVPTPVERVQSADDAVVVCWDRHNEVRLDVVASLLGVDSEAAARAALGGLVFEDPQSGALIRKAEYLSGNVRAKFTAAQQAAATDDRFAGNVAALQQVLPRDLTPAEISARLGSPWIAASHVQQFLREILDDPGVTVTNVGAAWSVSGAAKTGVLATTVWGTRSRTATDLAANLLNSQSIEITKTIGTGTDKRTVRDLEATAMAQAKAEQLDGRFRAWLWEDPDRSAELARTYNDRFNARVVRTYDGEHITAPGMSAAFTLRPHQMAAVARIRNSRGVGLFHGTGAGKTLEMIVGGMELVRLGLVSKPAYVVPKGVLGQFRREFLQAYPRAKVLAADTEDLEGDKRRQFVARCSTGAWDAIIISHGAFKKIPVSRANKVAYLNKQLDRLKSHLENAVDADRFSVKDVEKQIQTLQEQIKEQLATPSDPGVEFERTGIGYLFIDEAHTYKNLRVISAINELAHRGNQITADLDMKLEYLRTISPRVVTLATATPIDNSPSEILTMTKYAAPELLAEMGIVDDDQYHAAFIQPRRRVEMRPDGSGFTSRTRHTRFVNLPEQKQLMYSWADVKLKEHLDLGEPVIIGGKPEILSVPASAELQRHLVSLAARAKAVTGGHPDQRLTTGGALRDDNILWISTDGRTASLDLRLIGEHTDAPQKLDAAADWLIDTWQRHRDDVYTRPDGTEEPIRGSLQLVFCDLGVPRDGRWNVYDGLRDALVARGMPADTIRFAQDATSRRQKDQLDQDARDGKIAVLIGSRAGLGTGRNIQRRVISVLQLDPTWKLSPVVQSLGRGQRQGNANPAIHHVFVVTENSYDPFLWQKVDDKARFTKQMLDPNDTTRIIDAHDGDGDGQIDPAVMFAVAAGRPELLELHRIEETVGALRLEQRIWADEQVTLKATVEQNRRSITELHRAVADLDDVLARRTDTRGEQFTMTLDGATFDSRSVAGAALVERLHRSVHTAYGRSRLNLGVLGGIAVHADIEPDLLGHRALLSLDGIADSTIELSQHNLDTLAASEGQDRVGLIRQLENKLAGADDLRARQQATIDRLQTNIERATDRIGKPFPQQADLDQHAAKLATLHRKLRIVDAAVPDSPAAPIDDASDAADDRSSLRGSHTADARRSPEADHPAPSGRADVNVGPEGVPAPTEQPAAPAAGLPELHRQRRGHPFYPPAEIAAAIPRLYGTDGISPERTMLHLHYFGGATDVWLAEYDPSTGEGFGYINLGDPTDAEWGYVNLPELEAINHGLTIIERDLHWTPVQASDAHLPGPRAPRQATPLPDEPTTQTPPTSPQPETRPVTPVPPAGNPELTDARPPEPGTTPRAANNGPEATLPLAASATGRRADSPASAGAAPSQAPPQPPSGPPPDTARTATALPGASGHIVAAEPGSGSTTTTASPGATAAAVKDLTAAAAEPTITGDIVVAGPSWAERIQVSDDPKPVVRGTTGGRREDGLRGLLKQHRFRWHSATREWHYNGRPADRNAALGDIRRWLAAQDRSDGHTRPTATAMTPTAQQQRIIEAFQAGHAVAVQALAGTGKTSTLLMLANARPDARIAYIAFNAPIAAEAAAKFPRHVRAATAHSFAREALGSGPLREKRIRTGARWPEEWAAHLNIDPHVQADGSGVVDADRVARLVVATVQEFRQSDADTIAAQHLPGDLATDQPDLARVVLEHARAAWADLVHPTGKLFFDHDDYLKAWALTHPVMPYDVIFFDEAQDINPVLRRLIQDQPAQTIVVGDSNQAIYGFRGAVDALHDWPADTELPLTQSWRFGPAVAEVGNQFLTLLGSRWRLSGNPALDSSIGDIALPDAVLARTNAGAVAAVADAFDAGRRVALVGGGKAIEDIAKAAQDLQAGRPTAHTELARFTSWNEVRAYVDDAETDAASLRAFVTLVDRRGAEPLLQMVRDLINENETGTDGKPAYDVIVSTAHKAKGREWDRVRIASDFPQPQTNQQTGKTSLPNAEQLRLAYVTVTRARRQLELGSLGWITELETLQARPTPMRAANAERVPTPDQAAGPQQRDVDMPAPQVEPRSPSQQAAPNTGTDERLPDGDRDHIGNRGVVDVPALALEPVEPARLPPGESALTPTQQYVASEVAKAGTGYSTAAHRFSAYIQLPTAEVAGLPATIQAALRADLEHVAASGSPREQSAALLLTHRWFGGGGQHTNAQQDAIAAAGVGSLQKDHVRVGLYGALSAAQFHALDDVHQNAIRADLEEIATSGATKTIPRNRTTYGTTIRGVTADHVDAANALLRAISLDQRPESTNAGKVGSRVWLAHLNPGDQIQHRGYTVTVDRIGLDGRTYLTNGAVIADRTQRALLLAAAPPPHRTPAAGDMQPHHVEPPIGEQPSDTVTFAATAAGNSGEPAHSPLSGFTAVEQAVIRNAVDDYAGFYALGPLQTGVSSTARYVSEGHLRDLVDRHSLNAVWTAVSAVIDATPDVLERSTADREQARADRHHEAGQVAADALTAFKSGDFDAAEQLAQRGRLIDPEYRPGRTEQRPYGVSWDEIDAAIANARHPQDRPTAADVNRPEHGADQPQHTAAQLARLDTAVPHSAVSGRPAAVHSRQRIDANADSHSSASR
ncbi:UvrD-helicase domain-containing protein [Dactylosporangium sp. NPDC000244]|uniref:UvrD-helicase domain-containing protein n=1 Tax=Dactylosporangium sp. NPDC000244 TaxID=3154365 RepID=UPI0033283C3F